jgi:diaminopimelate dehydrogenase
MGKIKVAVVGLGNIGKAACDAVLAAPDMELLGIVRRAGGEGYNGIRVVSDASELGGIDAVIVASPSRNAGDVCENYLKNGISTVDSFDIHQEIWDHRTRLDKAAKEGGAVSIISAGWDPGTDSVIRALLAAMAPKGVTHTNFGPGLSMGHTVAVKAISGVRSALSITIPAGMGRHDRLVYVQPEPGADKDVIVSAIKNDPYFVHDKTSVVFVDNTDELADAGHGVSITRKGVSGAAHNQRFEFSMSINNPALTAQVMVSCLRAAQKQRPGCYTMIELPPIDLLPGEREEVVRGLV